MAPGGGGLAAPNLMTEFNPQNPNARRKEQLPKVVP